MFHLEIYWKNFDEIWYWEVDKSVERINFILYWSTIILERDNSAV